MLSLFRKQPEETTIEAERVVEIDYTPLRDDAELLTALDRRAGVVARLVSAERRRAEKILDLTEHDPFHGVVLDHEAAIKGIEALDQEADEDSISFLRSRLREEDHRIFEILVVRRVAGDEQQRLREIEEERKERAEAEKRRAKREADEKRQRETQGRFPLAHHGNFDRILSDSGREHQVPQGELDKLSRRPTENDRFEFAPEQYGGMWFAADLKFIDDGSRDGLPPHLR